MLTLGIKVATYKLVESFAYNSKLELAGVDHNCHSQGQSPAKGENMKSNFAVIILLAITLLVSGCATILKGSSETVSFNSNPAGATVLIDGSPVGKTPTQLSLASKNSYKIEIKKDGYEPSNFILSNKVGAGWVILDVICGVVPVVIDLVTGSFYMLDQSQVNVSLEKKK